MKIQQTWLPRTWVQPLLSARQQSIAKDILDKLSTSAAPIRLSVPDRVLYLPHRHWLVYLNKIEHGVKLSEIPEKLRRMNQGIMDGVWHLAWGDVVALLSRQADIGSDGFWARDKDKYFQCNQDGKVSAPTEQAELTFIPIFVLNKKQTFLDYSQEKGWVVDPDEWIANDVRKYLQAVREDFGRSLSLSGEMAQSIHQFLLSLDHWQANLPVLESSWLTDANRGLWEIAWPHTPLDVQRYIEVHFDPSIEGRDPIQDIRKGVVSIDFGTSTTVVAVRENGVTELLRVGVSDLLSAPEPRDYQNPTVVEFINYPKMMSVWGNEAHRPLISWQDVRVSHAAQDALRQHSHTNWQIVVSSLSRLKQIPLHYNKKGTMRLVDQANHHEFEVPLITERWPVKGAPVYVRPEDSFDPIELYAFYLGLAINHRMRGIFLRYFMTFPVNYPREVKQIIRASFSRGLMRSLPATMTNHPKLAEFKVQELATEPAAYAVSALQKLRTTSEGEPLAYGVFDFGGGTTDFDFGVYRTATADEEHQGYETVLEHCGASGDIFLGGENLIEHLAYQVFQQNLQLCRAKAIQFTCPPDAIPFPGSEWLVTESWYAKTNMTILMTALRVFWENSGKDFDNNLSLELVNNEGKVAQVTLTVEVEPLLRYLHGRLVGGIEAYFVAMRTTFSRHGVMPGQVHILLAGNASNSWLLQQLFLEAIGQAQYVDKDGEQGLSMALKKWLEGWCLPEFIFHPPLPEDPNNPFVATGKTGVALGLLNLIPGEPVLVKHPSANGQAPFRYFVGRYVHQGFSPVLIQNNEYEQWKALGIAPGGAMIVVYTTTPIALAEPIMRGDPALREVFVEFSGDVSNEMIFVRAISPDTIELAVAPSLMALEEGSGIHNLQTLTLSM